MKTVLLLITVILAGSVVFWQSVQVASAVRRQELAPIECGENQCCGGISTPPSEPQCPPAPSGYLVRNPGIPSGSLCRGACGIDCDYTDACTDDIIGITRCFGNATSHRWCTYSVTECGSHQACRTHDQCFDNCVAFLPPSEVANCQNGCNIQCIEDWNDLDCAAWATGHGPQPDRLKYTFPPIVGDLYDGPC